MSDVKLYHGDVQTWEYDGPLFHAMLCDPPYELGFMGKHWDKSGVAFQPETWARLAGFLHPGAFVMAFGGSRTFHRLVCALEDAGLIIHPTMCWLYGSGFPKATRIDTQIDKAAGMEQIEIGEPYRAGLQSRGREDMVAGAFAPGLPESEKWIRKTSPVTPLAATWEGHRYGLQALKPAAEFIVVAQKPYRGKPVECITETGAGALWIDGGRIPTNHIWERKGLKDDIRGGNFIKVESKRNGDLPDFSCGNQLGRWPANLILDEEAARVLGEQSGESRSNGQRTHKSEQYDGVADGYQRKNKSMYTTKTDWHGESDTGTAARFFYQVDYQLEQADPFLYCAKAARSERDAGLWSIDKKNGHSAYGTMNGTSEHPPNTNGKLRNTHPTVKPIKLCQYLATLLLPPAEYAPRRMLVPFAGSGSEMIGAGLAGWEEVIGCELLAENVEIARARLDYWQAQMRMAI